MRVFDGDRWTRGELVTTTDDGLMSKEDKIRLESIGVSRKLYINGEYPARDEGVTNIFVGEESPGTSMNPDEDVWTAPSRTIMDTVASEVNNQSSDLHSAIKDNYTDSIYINSSHLGLIDNRQPSAGTFYPSTGMISGVPAWMFDDTAVENVGTTLQLPSGWSMLQVKILWTHDKSNATGGVTWIFQINSLDVGVNLSSSGSNYINTGDTPAAKNVAEAIISRSVPLPLSENRLFRLGVARQGNGTGDTFVGDVGLIGVVLERVG